MTGVSRLIAPSRATILKVDIELVGCPGELTELTALENGVSRPIFTENDVNAVRRAIGRADVGEGTFVREFREYLGLKGKLLPVFGFGHFVRIEDVASLHAEVDAMNAGLVELRARVCRELDRLHPDPVMHERIRRFNPRIKLGTYILSEAFASDKHFQRAVEIACEKRKLDVSARELLGVDAVHEALKEAAEADKKSSGVTSYRWNPPKWTEEELHRSTEAHSRFLNASAKRTGLPAAWVRACGGIPDPDLR